MMIAWQNHSGRSARRLVARSRRIRIPDTSLGGDGRNARPSRSALRLAPSGQRNIAGDCDSLPGRCQEKVTFPADRRVATCFRSFQPMPKIVNKSGPEVKRPERRLSTGRGRNIAAAPRTRLAAEPARTRRKPVGCAAPSRRRRAGFPAPDTREFAHRRPAHAAGSRPSHKASFLSMIAHMAVSCFRYTLGAPSPVPEPASNDERQTKTA